METLTDELNMLAEMDEVELQFGEYELLESYKLGPNVLAIFDLNNEINSLPNIMVKDWNLADTKKDQDEIIKMVDKIQPKLAKLRDKWKKEFHGSLVNDFEVSQVRNAVKELDKTGVMDLIRRYEKMLKSNQSFFKTRSKSAQERLAGIWDDMNGSIKAILTGFKEIEKRVS